MPDGSTRTDAATFTAEEIEAAGYAEAPEMPSFDPATHYVDWHSNSWVVLPHAGAVHLDSEDMTVNMWRSVQAQRDKLLAATDWIALMALEKGKEIAPEWKAYRQALRDITLQGDPWNIVWPIAPA
jgi:hypothetical protein